MDQADSVRRRQALRGIPGNAQDRGNSKLLVALQALFESFAMQELHRNEQDAAVFAYLIYRNNVLVLDRSRRLCFAKKAFSRRFTIAQWRLHDFQCHATSEQQILRKKHDTHATRPEDFKHTIRSQPADFVRSLRGSEKG